MKKFKSLKRPTYRMPSFINKALVENKVLAAYQARPPYQQNDYISWITRAKLDQTQKKRLTQMIDELKRGDVYMKMTWKTKNK